MRLIDADKAKEEILSRAVDLNNPQFLSKADTLCIIDQQPTIDAEPVKHGRWALDSKDLCHCTVCNCYRNIKTQVWWDNCPNCGAKMDLEES